MINLGKNIPSLQMQRSLSAASDELARSFERMSSGQRINRASDDAAGLAIASSLEIDTRIFTQGARNLNDGVSLLNVAEGSLRSLSDIVTRQKELAEQAANGVYSSVQRAALHNEANALVDEFNRVLNTTTFNGTKILDGTQGILSLQSGVGTTSVLSVTLADELTHAFGNGAFSATLQLSTGGGNARGNATGDYNRDGYADFVIARDSGTVGVALGNGNGTFKAFVDYGIGGAPTGVLSGDLNGDGKSDLVSLNNSSNSVSVLLGVGDGTFNSAVNYSLPVLPFEGTLADLNGDGSLDIVAGAGAGGSAISVLMNNGNGTFKAATSYASALLSWYVDAGDINGDGKVDLSVVNQGASSLSIFIGNGDGSFLAATTYSTGPTPHTSILRDFNRDGKLDVAYTNQGGASIGIRLGNGDGTFKVNSDITFAGSDPRDIKATDNNGDGYYDLVVAGGTVANLYTLVGNGDGTFKSAIVSAVGATSHTITVNDFNEDGVEDVISSPYFNATTTLMTASAAGQTTNMAHLYLLTQVSARSTLSSLESLSQSIATDLGTIGSFQSRVQSALNTVQATRENYSAAESRITDVDVATEVSNSTRLNILQSTTAKLLASANLAPKIALDLLVSGLR